MRNMNWRVSCEKHELLREHLLHLRFFVGVRVPLRFSFLCFIFCFVYLRYVLCPILPVSLGCPFWNAPSGFTNVYLIQAIRTNI
jgi:hypothetical protein